MGKELGEICRDLKIRQGNFSLVKNKIYRDKRLDSEKVVGAITSLREEYVDFMMFGGQTAHPELLGFRNMRISSDDVDSVITVNGLCDLSRCFNNRNLFYIPEFQKVYLGHKGVPFIFALDYIHDWEIDPDFRHSSVFMYLRGVPVELAAPEYTIMMKMRRAQENGRFFGKDRLDIANLLLAPYFKEDLNQIDFDRLGELVSSNLPRRDIGRWVGCLEETENHLRKRERPLFRKAYEKIRESIEYYS